MSPRRGRQFPCEYMQNCPIEPYAQTPICITRSRLILPPCRFAAGANPHAYKMLTTYITSVSPHRGRQFLCTIYTNLPKGTICSYPRVHYTLVAHISSASLRRRRESLYIQYTSYIHFTSESPHRGRESLSAIYAKMPRRTICSHPHVHYTLAPHISSVSLRRGRQSPYIQYVSYIYFRRGRKSIC